LCCRPAETVLRGDGQNEIEGPLFADLPTEPTQRMDFEVFIVYQRDENDGSWTLIECSIALADDE
jgi:hypothetical protein